MKKSLFACVVVLLLLSASSAFAMDYVLGARAGFFFWSPYYKDMPENTGFDDIRTGHGGLYGPIFILNFSSDLSFSVSGLFGQQTTQWHSWNGIETEGTRINYLSRTSYLKANRYDMDSAISYGLLPGIRLFLGYKFQYMDVDWVGAERRYIVKPPEPDEFRVDEQTFTFKVPIHGFALGCGYSRSITDLYFVSVNISGIYARGVFKYTHERITYDENSPNPLPPDESSNESGEFDIQQYGFNIEPSIGIRTSGPMVTLGVRYQLLRTQFYELESSGGGGPDDRWMNDHLYGVFVAVMFAL